MASRRRRGPGQVAQFLAALGVDVAGVNCSLGPARMLEFIAEMHGAEPALRLAAMPNAGLPYRAGERMVYPSAPRYFAERVPQFLAAGALLVGGAVARHRAHPGDACCARRSGAAGGAGCGPAVAAHRYGACLIAGLLGDRGGGPGATGLLEKLRGQVGRQRRGGSAHSFTAAKMLEGARIALEHGADAVNVADSPMAACAWARWRCAC